MSMRKNQFGKSVVLRNMVAAAGLAMAVMAAPSFAQGAPAGSAFTYQAKITEGGAPINNACDFRFRLYDAATGGTQIGSTLALSGASPVGGLLTVSLDFGAAAFGGQARYLEVEVRNPAGTGTWTILTPRQLLTAVP